MPFSDRPPALVVGDCPEGHAELLSMVREAPELMGKIAECTEYRLQTHPIYVDDDWLRPKYLPPCANRSRAGVRDMNWCCRCLQGFPGTFQETAHEEFRDSAIRI